MSKLKVLIIESSSPEDFYSEELDGPLTQRLLKVLRISSKLIYALDQHHFEKAITFGAKHKYDVVHVSCHGSKKGLFLANETRVSWARLAKYFAKLDYSPKALVMSSCFGGSKRLGDAFNGTADRPEIIVGSTDDRFYNEYAVAWAILYDAFKPGVSRAAARDALAKIGAAAHESFRYLRWDDTKEEYRVFPGARRNRTHGR